MFYSQIILAKKGPLGQLWLAAHFNDRKLSRPQIFATDISESVDNIVHPTVPLALRVSGHLLLGVVRIYSRKVHYLWQDCHQAMSQIQMAFLQPNAANTEQAAIDMKEGKETKRSRRSRSDRHDKEGDAEAHQLEEAIPATTALQGFDIPFDLNDDTFQNAEDWVPAELDRDSDEDPAAAAAAALGLPDPGSPQQERRALARAAADLTLQMEDSTTEGRSIAAAEEQWTVFDPDEDEMPPEKRADTKYAEDEYDDDESESNAPQLPPQPQEEGVSFQAPQEDEEEVPIPPTQEDEDVPMLPQDEEPQPPAEEEEHPADQSSTMQAELPRADESVASDLAAGRPSAMGELGEPRMSEAEFSMPHDVSGIQILDEDETEGNLPADRRASSFHLNQSSSDSIKPHDESSAAAVSLGGGSTPGGEGAEGGKPAKKRKTSAGSKKKRKRRKVQASDGEIELTSAQIRTMLVDVSDILNRPIPIGDDEDSEDFPPELRNLVVFNASPLLMNYLTYDQLLNRAAAFDDGGASPDLLELWAECARLRDAAHPQAPERQRQPQTRRGRTLTRLAETDKEQDAHYDAQELKNEEDDESIKSVSAESQDNAQELKNEEGEGFIRIAGSQENIQELRNGEGDESIQSEGSAEGGRFLQEAETEAPRLLPEDVEDNMPLPPDEDEQFPQPIEEEDASVPTGEEQAPAPLPADEDEGDEEARAQEARKSSLSLGLVNTLGEDMEWDAQDEENEEDARQAGGDEIVSSNSKWHKHTIKVYSLLKSRMALPGELSQEKESHLYYNSLSDGCSRRTAVGVFFELLQLKTWDFIELNQEEPYGDITIAPGVKFAESVPK